MNTELTTKGPAPIAPPHQASKSPVYLAKKVERESHLRLMLVKLAFTGDALSIIIGLCLASWLSLESPLAKLGTLHAALRWTHYWPYIALGTALYLCIFGKIQLYDYSLLLRLRKVLATITRGAMIWFIAYLALVAFLRFDGTVSRLYLLLSLATSLALVVLWRILFYATIARDEIASTLRRRILFVGWSPPATELAMAIARDRRHPYIVVGCVPSAQSRYQSDPPVEILRLGDYGAVRSIVESHQINMVIVADMNPSTGELIGLANLCEKELVGFKVIPGCFEVLQIGLHLETVSGVPVLGVSHLPLDSALNRAIKRIIDVLGSIIGLLLASPLIAIFATMVYLESPGPVIYRQRRVGRSGEPFYIYKIRSMKLDAEASGKVGWSTKNDDRRLKVGGFIRRWNIDEVPQFWNVIQGQMSLVGPRPERPELIVGFKEEIPHYNARHHIKPGITGWAQVNGLRGDTDLNKRIQCDLYYIENWSPLLDMQIMIMTFFKNENAA